MNYEAIRQVLQRWLVHGSREKFLLMLMKHEDSFTILVPSFLGWDDKNCRDPAWEMGLFL